jgi:peptidoglycan glycosyltransferase
VVLLHVPSGQLLAAASAPSYNPARLGDLWDDLRGDPRAPLFHRGVSGLYSPGSTFKLLTMIAALEEGVISAATPLECTGGLTFENFTLRDSDSGSHGILSPREALTHSCNIAFAQVGLRLGVARLNSWMEKTQLLKACQEVPGSVKGLPAGQDGRRLSTAQAAIGQGSLLVTPLGMARLAAAVARGGVDIEPRVYRGQRRDGQLLSDAAPVHSQKVMQPDTARQLAEAMRAVVQEGTGTRAALPEVAVAGKTGTAENPRGRPDAWFIGYAPARQPLFAVAVVLENAGYGGEHAAPLARQVLQAAMRTPLGTGGP